MRLTRLASGATWAVLAVLALAVAGVTHAGAVLLAPWRSHGDAFARVAALGPPGRKVDLPEPGAPDDPLPFRDPAMIAAVCRYDLATRPFRLSMTPFEDGFVTVGFHSQHGLAFYGMTVRAVDATTLDLALAAGGNKGEAGVSLGQHLVTIEAPDPEGFVVLATPADDGPHHLQASERLRAFTCRVDGR